MTTPTYFESAAAFRAWLAANGATTSALLVGFRKVGSVHPSISWSDSVDEALCFGWIDGVRTRIDDDSYSIRFTPRRATSIWSAVNISKIELLRAQGRLTEAGAQVFAQRKENRSAIYSYEQMTTAEFSAEELQKFRQAKEAWNFFETTPASYKKVMLHWVTAAKKSETRAARIAKLVASCSVGIRLR